jgi:hypothetical protein
MNLKRKSKPIIINKKKNHINKKKSYINTYNETFEYNKIIIHDLIKSFKIINNKIISLKFIRNNNIQEVKIDDKYKNYNITEIKIRQLQAELFFKINTIYKKK